VSRNAAGAPGGVAGGVAASRLMRQAAATARQRAAVMPQLKTIKEV